MSRQGHCFYWPARQSKRVFGGFPASRSDHYSLSEQRKRLQLAVDSSFLNGPTSRSRDTARTKVQL